MEQAIVEQQENLIRLQRIDIESMTIKRVMDAIPGKKKALEEDLQSLSRTVEDAETAREALQRFRAGELPAVDSPRQRPGRGD